MSSYDPEDRGKHKAKRSAPRADSWLCRVFNIGYRVSYMRGGCTLRECEHSRRDEEGLCGRLLGVCL